jgi:prevent-host-death family protein
MAMKTINASAARKYFADVLASVVTNGEPLIIVRYNDPIAALVPIGRLDSSERPTPRGRPEARSGRKRS